MRKITFKNSEGLSLVGSLHQSVNGGKSKAVIIAHGFASNKDRERHIKLANALSESGITALRFDFAGSGESDNREIIIGAQVDDLRSAISYIHDDGYKDIGVLGESLGGITALLAINKDIRAMVLWAPVTKASSPSGLSASDEQSLKEKGYYIEQKDGKGFKIPKQYIEGRREINREEVLGKIKIPVLIVHGTADTEIPIKDSEEAIEFLPAGSRLEAIENLEHGDHRMDADMDIIIPITLKWFQKHLE